MKRSLICLLALLIIPLCTHAENAAVSTHKLKLNGGSTEEEIRKVATGHWSVTRGATSYACQRSGQALTVTKDNAPWLTGKAGSDKASLLKGDGSTYLSVKYRSDKIKLTAPGVSKLWEFKISSDKIKVRVGEKEYGKVKYYADTGKTKAKTAAGAEVAAIYGLGRNSAAPGVILVNELDHDQTSALMLLLLVLGK